MTETGNRHTKSPADETAGIPGRIYLISYRFAPLGRAAGINRTYLAKFLAELGWDVEVVTGIDYKSLLVSTQKDPKLLDILPPEVRIHRFPSDHGWLMRDLKFIFKARDNYCRSWVNYAEQSLVLEKPGIIFSVAHNRENAELGYRLARKFGLPLVLYYPDETIDVPSSIVNHAKLVVCVTEDIREYIRRHYGHPDIVVMENGYMSELEVPERKAIDLPIKMVYAGSFSSNTRPEIVMQAYSQLRKEIPGLHKELTIDFIGAKNLYYYLKMRKWETEGCRCIDYMPFEELNRVLPRYDMAIASAGNVNSFVSKIYHYMNAGLPILSASIQSGLKKFSKRYNTGVYCNLDSNQVKESLRYILSDNREIPLWRNKVLSIRRNFAFCNQVNECSEIMVKKFLKTEIIINRQDSL